MTTKAQTVAGTSIAISASLPATYDNSGFSALTYTTLGEVTDIGTFGKDYTLVTHNPLNDRKTYKFRGSYNNGSLSVKLAKATLVSTDAGQVIALAASNSDSSYSFRVTNQDGSKAYFTAKTMSFMTNVGSINSILGAEIKLELDSDITENAT